MFCGAETLASLISVACAPFITGLRPSFFRQIPYFSASFFRTRFFLNVDVGVPRTNGTRARAPPAFRAFVPLICVFQRSVYLSTFGSSSFFGAAHRLPGGETRPAPARRPRIPAFRAFICGFQRSVHRRFLAPLTAHSGPLGLHLRLKSAGGASGNFRFAESPNRRESSTFRNKLFQKITQKSRR